MKKEKNKILGAILGILFYLFVPFLFFMFYIIGGLGITEVIWYYSSTIFNICHIYIPIILILLPLVFKFILKKQFYKSILYSIVVIIIYIPMVFILQYGITNYMRDFTQQKWNNYIDLRYLMIEDFEEKYETIGKEKEDIYKILGTPDVVFEPDTEMGSFCYQVGYDLFDVKYYCFIYDDKNIIVETK